MRAFRPGRAPIDPAKYETTRVWYHSKDGTRVSMFLVHRRDAPKDGARPVLLSGYGGFHISLTPAFDPSLFVWLDRGGVYAVAHLRGGGEYGEAWHEAGLRERKQTVSPLHNVRDGVLYPPILITTADTDDRVAPGMAKKLAARLQAAGGGQVLIRVETKAGHGAGKPVTKVIDEDADIYAFLFRYL